MKSMSLMVMFLAMLWPWSSAKTYHMKANNSVPAATGIVKAQKGNANGNTKLDIKVANLAEPSNLTPPADVYIVWVRPSDEVAVKKGVIRVGKDLNGELNVVTTSRNCDVFITAEQSPSVSVPSGVEVLHTHVELR